MGGEDNSCFYQNQDPAYNTLLIAMGRGKCISCTKDEKNLNCPSKYFVTENYKKTMMPETAKMWRMTHSIDSKVEIEL